MGAYSHFPGSAVPRAVCLFYINTGPHLSHPTISYTILPFQRFAEIDKTCPPESHQAAAAPGEEEHLLLLLVAEAVVLVVGAGQVVFLALLVSIVSYV
jgi:hypothetical protein